MTIIGIDPGKHGAVAFVSEAGLLSIVDTPTLSVKKKGQKTLSTEYDIQAMVKIVPKEIRKDCLVYIERQWARPGMSAKATQAILFGYGLWLGILSALEMTYVEVSPQEWKKHFWEKKVEKEASVKLAQEIFYEHGGLFVSARGKKLIDRADAVLIAEYGRQRTEVLYK